MLTNEFISECMSGSEEAVRLLVRTHQRAIFQLALSVLDRTDAPIDETVEQAELATRDAFLTALDRLGRYRPGTPFSIWLYQIVIEISQKRFRTWQRARRLKQILSRLPGLARLASPSTVQSSPPAEAPSLRSPAEEALWQTVRGMDEKLRLPVVLRYYHDFQIHEIAGILRLNEGAVHARLDQAREKLAQL